MQEKEDTKIVKENIAEQKVKQERIILGSTVAQFLEMISICCASMLMENGNGYQSVIPDGPLKIGDKCNG
jgi:hypothetical protein